jgi:1-acyl-sn-glycerol-3-phosphate acyltransferase
LPSRFQAGWSRALCRFLSHTYVSRRVTGREFIPAKGPVILAGNHAGLVDGPLVLGASSRGVHFIIKFALSRGLGGKILLAAGQVPLGKDSGREALATCLDLLKDGRVVGIFPEGSRGDGRMAQIHPGVGWLAVHSGAPVIPFACLGTRRQGESIRKLPPFRRKLAVVFGPAIDLALDPALPTRDRIGQALGVIGPALAAHVAAAQEATGLYLPTDSGRKEEMV